jgi:hypothetical protein
MLTITPLDKIYVLDHFKVSDSYHNHRCFDYLSHIKLLKQMLKIGVSLDINVKDNKLNSNTTITVPTPYLFLWRQIGDSHMIVKLYTNMK